MELIYYVRKPDSREVVAEKVQEDVLSPEPSIGKGWYLDKKVSHVKLSRGVPMAVVVSNGYNSVGWAVCSHGDTFNKKKGLMIARAREKNGFSISHVPEFMKEHINIMLEKSRQRFEQ